MNYTPLDLNTAIVLIIGLVLLFTCVMLLTAEEPQEEEPWYVNQTKFTQVTFKKADTQSPWVTQFLEAKRHADRSNGDGRRAVKVYQMATQKGDDK